MVRVWLAGGICEVEEIPQKTTGEERAGFEGAKHWFWEVEGMFF